MRVYLIQKKNLIEEINLRVTGMVRENVEKGTTTINRFYPHCSNLTTLRLKMLIYYVRTPKVKTTPRVSLDVNFSCVN